MCMMAHALSLQVVKATNVVVMNCAEIEIQSAKFSQGGLGELGSTGPCGTGGYSHLDWAGLGCLLHLRSYFACILLFN